MIEFFKSKTLQPAVVKLLKQNTNSKQEADWLRNLDPKVHKNESGYLNDEGEHYLKVGLSAMDCTQRSLESASSSSPKTILDFPCGYGRVMRFLRVAFPDAQIEGSDLDKKAIQFCSRVFGAKTTLSMQDFEVLQLNKTFDLIWCGSLVTHLDKQRIAALLRFFYRHLNPGGVCIFTSHGIRVEDLLARGEINYSLTPDRVERVLQGYRDLGIGFSEYNQSRDGYGISLTSDAIIRELANEAGQWSCVLFEPAGWDNHQDVYSFRKDG